MLHLCGHHGTLAKDDDTPLAEVEGKTLRLASGALHENFAVPAGTPSMAVAGSRVVSGQGWPNRRPT